MAVGLSMSMRPVPLIPCETSRILPLRRRMPGNPMLQAAFSGGQPGYSGKERKG